MGSRTWIKIYCDKWLEGSLREEPLAMRAVWIDLLTLAGSGKYGDSGHIGLTKNIGLSNADFVKIFNISIPTWSKIRLQLVATNRIKILHGNVIEIVNWSKYQSEYNRQRPYRQEKEPESCNQKLHVEKEKEKEKEKESAAASSSLGGGNDSSPPLYDSDFETVRTAYEQDFGLLVPLQGQMIEDALRRWPVVWIVEAMNIAVANNVRKWAYVKGILERWENEGKGNENESKQDTEFPPYEEIVAPDGHLIGVGQTIEDIRRRDREAGF